MPYDVPPNLGGLSIAQITELAVGRKLPPVDDWNPEIVGDSEMRIAADGRWFHQGGEVTRPAMIRAFSSLLRRDPDGSYWLVTPHERLSIIVDDVPFIAVEMQVEGKGRNARIGLRLNSDDLVIAGAGHEIGMRCFDGIDVPYLHVRGRLWARASRALSYQMIDLALTADDAQPGLWSEGIFFSLTPAG